MDRLENFSPYNFQAGLICTIQQIILDHFENFLPYNIEAGLNLTIQ